MTILVTGAAGFIGANVCRALQARGDSVVGIDNYSKYGPVRHSYDDRERYTFVQGDVQDTSLMRVLMEDVDHVIAHPRGPTELANLMCLCRHHHRLKQEPRWAVQMTPEGVVTWTTPIGDEFTTWPVDHLGVRGLAS